MRKIILISSLIVSVLVGCDSSESFDAIITNGSDIDLRVNFVSDEVLSGLLNNTETLDIKSGTSKNYQRIGADSGIGQARLTTLVDFDSIYLTDVSGNVLKVYKEGAPGKNIYNIDEYWKVKNLSKSHLEYIYTITNEDIGN